MKQIPSKDEKNAHLTVEEIKKKTLNIAIKTYGIIKFPLENDAFQPSNKLLSCQK